MLPHEPTWATVWSFSAGSVALGAIATVSILNALTRRGRSPETPRAKRQKLAPPEQSAEQHKQAAHVALVAPEQQQDQELPPAVTATAEAAADAPATPDAEASAEPHGMPHTDSLVDLQKLQELEQRVADLNALAELGKVYQDSLALSAQLRNLSSFRLQQDKMLGRGSLAVVQEGEYAGDSVAVKLLPIGSVFAEDSRKEACLALCLHHPNIVRVVGVHLVDVEAKPYLALVQETAPGGDLGWQIEDCGFHAGRGGSASMDVALKLLLDAARGLAYMHDVDVVHGDVKSRNLLVFWEDGDDAGQADGEAADARGDDEAAAEAAAAAAAAQHEAQRRQAGETQQREEGEREMAWALKWCDFGVSFRAAEAPGGILRTATGTPGFRAPEVMDVGWGKAADTYAFAVIAWQLLTGSKPIVYDREWRKHAPNPDLLRCDRTGGAEEPPRALQDLVWDCGSYSPQDRPSMREVVDRLEEIAMQRLQKQQAEQHARQAAADTTEAAETAKQEAVQQAAEVAAQQQQERKDAAAAAAAERANQELAGAAAKQAAAHAAAVPPPSAADAAHLTCPTCQRPNVRAGFGGLAHALSLAAREAAAGGAAAEAAAAAQHLQHLQREQLREAMAAAAAAAAGADTGEAAPRPGPTVHYHHTYEVLIQNDDDPLTAEAVAHTLDQCEGGSLKNLAKVLAGHPQALTQLHQQQQQQGGTEPGSIAVQQEPAGTSLHLCASAPAHSQLLDAAVDAAAAGSAAAAAAAQGAGCMRSVPTAPGGGGPSSPVSVVGAVSRSNIEMIPAQGPSGLPPSASAAAAAAAAAGLLGSSAAPGGGTGTGTAPAAAAAASGASGAPSGGWFVASGSSFRKGLWLEKLPVGTRVSSPRAASASPPDGQSSLQQQQQQQQQQQRQLKVQQSPTASKACSGQLSLRASQLGSYSGVSLPDSSSLPLQGSFSLQLRREAATAALPSVAEDDAADAAAAAAPAAAGSAGDIRRPTLAAAHSLPVGWDAGGAAPAAAGSGAAATAESAAAARLLRRQRTTQRLGTDVLAAAGALSKALGAFSSASQALTPAAAAGGSGAADGGSATSAGGAASTPAAGVGLLLTPDFVAAARG
ncbi:hypothetical protein COO60DRAFT_411169 [Scenedesmus sp. NREL 46B-D3]|nr:hypothetical protein COO60DRAFT_411169 [Scenedesmus sp. NREL 46B-D3]